MNKERLQAMGKMAATLAHEIRNPLGSIQLYSSLLIDDLIPDSKERDLAEKIHRGIRHLEQVIENSLTFTRCDTLNLTELSIVELLKEVVELQVPGEVTVDLIITQDHLVTADKSKIKQVLVNIVRNAIEAASESEDRLVRLSTLLVKDKVCIRVEDSGSGIDPEIAEHIFDPFYTSKTEGTGLGLSVAASVINSHSGEIKIFSSELGGALFEILI